MTVSDKMKLRAQKYDLRQAALTKKEKAVELRRERRLERKEEGRILKTASHLFMAGVMIMFFVGVALGVYVTVFKDEPVIITLDYIMKLAMIVALGYFVKAFGENVAKMVLGFLTGRTVREEADTRNDDDENHGVG